MKKKILIFSSHGGGGHTSATDALYAYLQNEYSIETAFIFDEVLGCIDPVKVLTFNTFSGEQLYNYCLRKKWTYFINFLYYFACFGLKIKQQTVHGTLQQFLREKKPDLIISVVPLVNGYLEYSCHKEGIPFLLIPTDLDITTFITTMKMSSEQVKIALAFKDSYNEYNQTKIPHQMIYFTGFPLKPSFFQNTNNQQIKYDFQIPEDKPIILLLMGASGSYATYNFVVELLQLTFSCHLLICLGRNESLRSRLKRLAIPGHISISVISHTNRIADLMAIAALCITKAGTVSVCETLYRQVPMILDATSTPLLWEKFNHYFIQQHGFGEVITRYDQLNPAIQRLLLYSPYREQVRNNLKTFEKINFGDHIKHVVASMMH